MIGEHESDLMFGSELQTQILASKKGQKFQVTISSSEIILKASILQFESTTFDQKNIFLRYSAPNIYRQERWVMKRPNIRARTRVGGYVHSYANINETDLRKNRVFSKNH